jgi:hypothetical protein
LPLVNSATVPPATMPTARPPMSNTLNVDIPPSAHSYHRGAART